MGRLTHHIPPLYSCNRPCQIPLCYAKPLDVRSDVLDDGFGFRRLLSYYVDLLDELLLRFGDKQEM